MAEYADLELSLHRREQEQYTVELRFTQPGSDADIRVGQGETIDVNLDLITLQDMIITPDEYGKMLAESLFADDDMKTAWAQARTSAETMGVPMRVRILIGPSAQELNTVYWEALCDPKDHTPLFTGENLLVARYLSSESWKQVKLQPKGNLRALTAAANPSDLDKLAPVDVAGELGRAKEALGDIPVTELPGSGGKHCSLDAITSQLREGFDILFLAAHGALEKGEPYLWLEDAEGKTDKVSGKTFAARLKELDNQPRLIVLASCQSAGKGAGDALQALGPKLAQAGIPAVIAMQGNISMETVKQFMPVFFSELEKDGQIDRALAVARGTVRDRHDFWMPVLFMRLTSGQIWYVPGFGDESGGFQKWDSITSSIARGQCTPILGPGMVEPLLGNTRDIAKKWAEKHHFPMSNFMSESLPAVMQYLMVNLDLNTLYNEQDEYYRKTLKNRLPTLPDNTLELITPLTEVMRQAGELARAQDPLEQHKILAKLPLPIYITTNVDNFLYDALKAENKDPQIEICPWSDRFSTFGNPNVPESIYAVNPKYQPTPQQPLIYHLFGHISVPDSMVLTEDDYFEFLIGFTNLKKITPPIIPPVVQAALTKTALMFLGFQLDDWSFRVIFRLVMGQQGGGLRGRFSHIGVQVEPDENRAIAPLRARKYLETYFQGSAISIYWGRSSDFIGQLARQLKLSV